ncbi:hypothetical protein RHGRI_034032 [Rhododendron griersonianum]|uniref:Uncharacterized protein n=1 Tax=Rhododendron griersonianum TaxID=479676 RepID=A0AAV6I4T3_9ERIC|nr:hypothetical protein RHGRI_034032 [Rhododendron griersonianum]
MTPPAMLSFSWSHHSGNKMVLELASPQRRANAAGASSGGAERAQPAIATNRWKGCKDLERKCKTANCMRGGWRLWRA